MSTNTTLEKDQKSANGQAGAFVSPDVNIFETNEGYVLEAEMPGVNKEGLDVTLEDNVITLTGRKQVEPLPGKALFRGSYGANYRRVFELDPAIDKAKVSAKIDQGLVTISLPKSEQVKPRKINVN
jgi:HSP20 family protein